ncbi:MAG: hypothetical protein JSW67_15395 [Candidatus Latescibacterota bacterium]|nr:MAG: hypothetical protein JSW67_15395 [Candidatus Latescibacterota bacterium]
MQRRRRILFWALLLLLARAPEARCGDGFEIDFFLGASKNFNSKLEIAQAGHPTLDFHAEYDSRSFEQPLYYAVRFAWLFETSGLELQLVHHKVHLTNPPPEVANFEVSHGFNLLTLNYVLRALPLDVRFGVGLVAGHTESTVRGLSLSGGGSVFGEYAISGPALIAGAGHPFPLLSRLVMIPEVYLSAARARLPVADGEASLYNVALHVMLGAGVRF